MRVKNRMVVSVSVVYPHDFTVDRELWLAAAAQLHKRGLDHISLAQEETKIQNLK